MKWTATSTNDLAPIARDLVDLLAECPIALFTGEMGVGKTTLIKAICAQLGISTTVTSPTFSLVNEYMTSTQDTLYHFDLHRIERLEELLDFGFEDYVDSGKLCLIEWPEIAQTLLPEKYVTIALAEEDGVRHISVNKT
jgi:tRNA threonylcarbamoyladenosine biosynthesis protein TsaE